MSCSSAGWSWVQAEEKVPAIIVVANAFGRAGSEISQYYLVNRAGVATCHNLVDGKKLWDLRLPGSCWASPLHAPGRVYFFTKEGATVVLKDDGSTEKLSENSLSIEGKIYGLAAAENAFIMRTGSELICLREPLTP